MGRDLSKVQRVSMKARLRVISLAVALSGGLAAPALAQNAEAPVTNVTIAPPKTSSDDSVGPEQLRNFSLGGTVTKSADAPPPAERTVVPAPAPATRQAQTDAAAPPAAVAPQRTAVAASAQRPATATPASSAAGTAFNFPPPTPAAEPAATFSPAITTEQPTALPQPPVPGTDVGGGMLSYWPWLLVLLAAAGAAAWYFRRPRSGYAFAGAGSEFELAAPPQRPARPAPQPQPAPSPAPRAAPPPVTPRAPVPEHPALSGAVVSTRLRAAPDVQAPPEAPAPAPAPAGIVSSRLRPWLEIEFEPLAAVIDEAQAAIEFRISLFNSGSAPARDVLVEARLFNAGAEQDEAIANFFANSLAEGERVPLIAPLQRMDFRTTATAPRDQIRIFEAGGRRVFVPLIGFNALYRWGGSEGQTSMSYLLGRNTSGEKMAPFVIGDGAKRFTGLGAREHTVRVRK